MPLYEIEQYEIHIQKHRVEADSEAGAIAKLRKGEADLMEGGSAYSGILEADGLPVRAHRILADELRTLGISVGQHVIPSIRSITKIE